MGLFEDMLSVLYLCLYVNEQHCIHNIQHKSYTVNGRTYFKFICLSFLTVGSMYWLSLIEILLIYYQLDCKLNSVETSGK